MWLYKDEVCEPKPKNLTILQSFGANSHRVILIKMKRVPQPNRTSACHHLNDAKLLVEPILCCAMNGSVHFDTLTIHSNKIQQAPASLSWRSQGTQVDFQTTWEALHQSLLVVLSWQTHFTHATSNIAFVGINSGIVPLSLRQASLSPLMALSVKAR